MIRLLCGLSPEIKSYVFVKFNVQSLDKIYPNQRPTPTNTFTQANTALNFTQGKFNLLREESQGFAKLITLLSHPTHPNFVSEALIITAEYKLDPTRVLDVTLDLAEENIEQFDAYAPLINALPVKHLLSLLSIKIQYYNVCNHMKYILLSQKMEAETPNKLMALIATLDKRGTINALQLLPSVHIIKQLKMTNI